MALHVQDSEADQLVRDFARRRGVGITEAIKIAVKEADKQADARADKLREAIAPLQRRMKEAMARKGMTSDDPTKLVDDGWDNL